MARRYTPTVPADLREAFDNVPVMVRARKARARLAACAGSCPYDRATELLALLDEVLAGAEAEWPVITGTSPHCSNLHSWLSHWGAAIDSACWRGRSLAVQVAA